MSERRIEYVKLSELKPARRNPKKHADEDLRASVDRFGFTEPLILDERTGRLVAGHGRLDALRAMLKANPEHPPRGIEAVGPEGGVEWLIPVVRGWKSADDREAEAYLVASNRLSEKGGWDDGALAKLLGELAEDDALAGVGYDSAAVDKLLAEAAANASDEPPAVETEELPPDAKKVYVKRGDRYQLGPHLVACADSYEPDVLDSLLGPGGIVPLVLTDPPYAIYGSSTGIGADIADDSMVIPFFEKVFAICFSRLKLFGHAYLFTDWRSWSAMWLAARRERMTPKNCIVWDKGGAGLGSMFAMSHEFVGFFVKQPPPKAMKSSGKQTGHRMVRASNLLHYPRVAGKDREHNAQKPVALLRFLIEKSSDAGDLVLDPFCGSGSTLIACHETKRRCVTIDKDPKWVQVTIERFERVTGTKPKKLKP